jgi:allantoinase
VSSDHVGWPARRKQGDDVFSLAAGAPGVELMLALLHDAIVERGLPLALLPRLLSDAPARRFGLWPRKGTLAPGADADIAIVDPDTTWAVDPTELATRAGWSPYSGRQLRGRVVRVIARGEQVFDGEGVLGAPGRGALVRPTAARELARA